MKVTPRFLEILALPTRPLTAQELHDEEFLTDEAAADAGAGAEG